jgi:iron(III) transport system ATP-binding protein
MPERLVVDRLSKAFGTNRALDDVSLDVPAGTFLVLLGPSGSGKTTLLRCVAGIERATSGRIVIGDTLVADPPRHHLPPEKRGLAMVFQDYALWPHMTARQNVAFALRRRRVGRERARTMALEMLERVGLAALAGRYPNELSGGEQQRVALARALVGDTGVLLFDEPLSNLDADLRERMRVEISSLVRAQGATTVYITHDQSEAFALADVVGVLQKGRMIQLAAPEVVYATPATPFTARFTGLAGELKATVRSTRVAEDGIVEVTVESRSGVRPVRARAAGRLSAGDEIVLMFRPAAVRLCAPDAEQRHLVATVSDVAFRGRGYEHVTELAEGERITGVMADKRGRRNDSVGLELDAGGCLVFAAEAASATDGRGDDPATEAGSHGWSESPEVGGAAPLWIGEEAAVEAAGVVDGSLVGPAERS